MIPFIVEPHSWIGKYVMFIIGMIIHAYGMGIYFSAQMGAGPRDSFMLALRDKTGWNFESKKNNGSDGIGDRLAARWSSIYRNDHF